MRRTYRFVWLDVFTRTPLEGNQLAVFPDATGLTDEEMQSIARETHLSETTFVFPRDPETDRSEGYRTRIFAVAYEMPFAGHPTLGTASVLSEATGANEVALALRVGKIPVHFSTRDGHRFGEMTQNDPEIGSTHDPAEVARALGVSKSDLDLSRPVQTVSTGVAFAIVPFRRRETLSALRPNIAEMEEYLRGTDAKFFYLVSTETVEPAASLHARMIFAGGDDPATGSAAGPAVAWMVMHGLAKPNHPVLIEQGLEVHRRAHLYAHADLRDGRPAHVRVGGHCTPVIHGELTV